MKCKYFKPYMKTLKQIVKGYYKMENCCSGGPLHILLDDDNYDMHSIEFCINHCFEILNNECPYKTDYSDAECILGIIICNEYAKMSLEERAIFDAYWCGYSMECDMDGKCCSDCEKRGDLYDFIKEKEEYHDQT